MLHEKKIDKNMLYNLLKELANKYRKYNKHDYAELVIVGGGSVVLNYNFRIETMDVDAIIHANSVIYDIAISLSSKYGISSHWLNSDFTILSSYSPKLLEVAKPYAVFNNGHFVIRTVGLEYLIAMKMQSGRFYSDDITDIIGILATEKKAGNEINYTTIMDAAHYLYGDKLAITETIDSMVQKYCNMSDSELWTMYNEEKNMAAKIKTDVKAVEREKGDFGKEDAKNIAEQIRRKMSQNDTVLNQSNDEIMVPKGVRGERTSIKGFINQAKNGSFGSANNGNSNQSSMGTGQNGIKPLS